MSELAMPHSHVFLGQDHDASERRTWWVIGLCAVMMALEIIGGYLFGSIALVADGLHMSTHAGALLLAALAYRYARRLAHDPRFSFGTGKLGDLAGFSSAIVLAMISLLIGFEAISRLFAPVPIHFQAAIPIAGLGLVVNLLSAWLLSGGHHHHGHSHAGHAEDGEAIALPTGTVRLSIFEDGVPPRFRLAAAAGMRLSPDDLTIETERPDGARQVFTLVSRHGLLESEQEIPEPHQFKARLHAGASIYAVDFAEHDHDHGKAGRDNNMRAAIVHVAADAAVSVLVIIGLLLARSFGWLWMDPLAGLIGAAVIASWSYGLIRDTGAILLDMNPDRQLAGQIRHAIETDGDRLADLHIWRLGPGHLGAIASVVTSLNRNAQYYHDRLSGFNALSHVTVEVQRTG